MRNWLLGQFASYREENYKPMRAADMNEVPSLLSINSNHRLKLSVL